MNTHATRNENILDLVLKSTPDLVKNLSVSHRLVHSDHLKVTFTVNVHFDPPAHRPKFIFDFRKANLIDLRNFGIYSMERFSA